MTTLKTCPFCGSSNLCIQEDILVSCESCGATGPVIAGEDNASSAWNSRTGISGKLAWQPPMRVVAWHIYNPDVNPYIEYDEGTEIGSEINFNDV